MANPTSYNERVAAQMVARTPEEKAYDESVEYTPEMLNRLDEAIAAEKNPKSKIILQQERVQLAAEVAKRKGTTVPTSSVQPVGYSQPPMPRPPMAPSPEPSVAAPQGGTDFMSKIQMFTSMDPSELVKKFPEIDPSKLLDKLQLAKMQMGNGQGLQPQGQQFAGEPTSDPGVLQGVPGAMPQGGQGFQMNAPSPWTPQASAGDPFAGVGADQGFKVSEGGAMGAPAGAASGIDPMVLAKLMGGMGQGLQPQQAKPTPPVVGPARPPGGANAKLIINMPDVQNMTEQMLSQLFKRSPYGA